MAVIAAEPNGKGDVVAKEKGISATATFNQTVRTVTFFPPPNTLYPLLRHLQSTLSGFLTPRPPPLPSPAPEPSIFAGDRL